jgi:hypothetical protein
MLERTVRTYEESMEIIMHTAIGLFPNIIEVRVIVISDSIVFRRQITNGGSSVALNFSAWRISQGNQEF